MKKTVIILFVVLFGTMQAKAQDLESIGDETGRTTKFLFCRKSH